MTFTRCFQNTMYIDIGKYMSIQNTCHNRTIICIESLLFCIVYTLYSTTVSQYNIHNIYISNNIYIFLIIIYKSTYETI